MLKLKRFSLGQWVPYPEAEGVRFKIRPLQLSDGMDIRSRIRERIVMSVSDPTGKIKKPIPTLMEDLDSGKFTWEIFDYILEDFEGLQVEKEDGVVLDCNNPAHKQEIKKDIFNSEALRDFISEKSEWLREQGAKQLGEEIKNSNCSQGG